MTRHAHRICGYVCLDVLLCIIDAFCFPIQRIVDHLIDVFSQILKVHANFSITSFLVPRPTPGHDQVRNRPAEAGSHQKIGRDSGRSQDEWTGSGRDEPIIAEEREGIGGRPGHFEGGVHSAAIPVRT